MTILSVTDASRMAGVSPYKLNSQIENGELGLTPDGIELDELIRVYPKLRPLANLKLRQVKSGSSLRRLVQSSSVKALAVVEVVREKKSESEETTADEAGTIQLLVRELEWNKQLLEHTNKVMAKQLAEQQAMIADQARRLDEKDRFWARQVEIAQSLLPAPAQKQRKKIFGIF